MAALGPSGSAAVVNTNGYRQFQAAQPQQQQPKGNFLAHLLPTIGGTGGGIAGGALGGAAAGTMILPGVGTVAGGLLGALLGGAAGGAGGKVLENHIEHQAMGNGVLGAGIENGVLSAGPLRLIKGGAALAGAGKGLAGSLIAPVAAHGAEQAVADTALKTAEQPLKTSAAGKLEAWGNNQLAKQWGTLDKPTIRATDPSGTVGKLANMGITKPLDAERIASGLTGSSGVVNKAVVAAVGSAGKVPTSGVSSVLDKAIAENGLVDKDAASVRQVVEAQLGKLGTDTHANPTQVMGVMKSIEQRIANLGGKGGNYKMATPERLDQAKALQAVHKELQDSLYKAAGADANVSSVLTPEVEKQLISLHPGNAQWAAHVKDNIMKSKTVGDLRSAQAPFVKAHQMIDNADANSFSMGGKIGNMLNGGGLKSTAANLAANVVKDPALRVAGTTARKLAGKESSSLLGALSAPGTKSIIRNEVMGTPIMSAIGSAMDGGKASAAPLDQAQATQGYTADQIAQMNPGGSSNDQTVTEDTSSPLNPANVEQGVQAILANGGKMSDVTAYVGLVKTLSDLKGGGAAKPLNSTQQQQAFNAQSGLQSLQQIQSTLQSNPNASLLNALPGGSFTHRVVGTGDYDAALKNVADVIGRLRSGGAIGEQEQKNFLGMLPKAGDSPQTQQYKIQNVANLLGKFANPQGATEDPSTLLSALGAQ